MDSSGFRSFLGLVKFAFGSERLNLHVTTQHSPSETVKTNAAWLGSAKERPREKGRGIEAVTFIQNIAL